MSIDAIYRAYLRELRTNLAIGIATEHSYRPALKALLEGAAVGVTATNEPKRIECGAPDFVVSRAAGEGGGIPQPVGYVEAKDCDVELSAIEQDSDRRNPRTDNGRQLKRYRAALSNLVLTNYLEFRWYLDGEPRQVVRLADLGDRNRLTVTQGKVDALHGLLEFFLTQGPAEVSSAEDLAKHMARIAHMIRNTVAEAFKQDYVSQSVRDLYAATEEALVPDLAEQKFADMFAQTLAYGLFAARVNHDGRFRWQDAAHDIPAANPFIRQVFDLVTGPDLNEEPFVSFVDDLAQLLDAAQMDLVLADFGKHGARQDPIMHFYETFLAAYDPALKKSAGVYYTPEQVISYIVRSVDHLLRERFDCPEGLADYGKVPYRDTDGVEREAHRVLVLDPACGTGSFLYAVIDHVREHYQTSGRAGMWRGYVKDHLLPRLFGFELLMAAYAMAHLKLGMQLAALDLPKVAREAWAYSFDAGERLGVYLTNTLDPSEAQASTMFGPLRALTAEASAAAEVKRELPIMVVLGNPPYSGHSANRGEWIANLIDDYKQGFPELAKPAQAKWLSDDYVKFIRFGQWRIDKSGTGILAFITNHSYLDNPTFRGMRRSLLQTFDEMYLLDLHGNSNRKERAPDGGPDKNVFDIRQGVAIGIFLKSDKVDREFARVFHADLWGERQMGRDGGKYGWLAANSVASTQWTELEPKPPGYLFIQRDEALLSEYEAGWSVPDIFSLNGGPAPGIVTTHDQFAISWTPEESASKVEHLLATTTEDEARQRWRLCSQNQWDYGRAKRELHEGSWRDRIEPILYRPFDVRYTVFDRNVAVHRRERVMRHMLAKENIGLLVMRQVALDDAYTHVGVSNSIVDNRTFYSNKGIMSLAPIYLYSSAQALEHGCKTEDARQPNLDLKFTAELSELLRLDFVSEGMGDLGSSFGPEDVFHYIYAVLHSPSYRERYAQFLRADFPRIPLPDGLVQFRDLAALGRELTKIHLLESSVLDGAEIGFPIVGDDLIAQGYPKYVGPGERVPSRSEPLTVGRVYINGGGRLARGQYFEDIAPEVWEFRIGGYQPLHKWLKDRKGRRLSFEDQRHYIRIAAALRETIRLTAAIDEVGLPFA